MRNLFFMFIFVLGAAVGCGISGGPSILESGSTSGGSNSPSNPTIPTLVCQAGQYLLSGVCTDVGNGNWGDGDGNLHACANAPGNAHYTSPSSTSSSCPWDCDDNYLIDNTATTCTAYANAKTLKCADSEIAVGIFGRTGAYMDNMGVRCAAFSNGQITGTPVDGPFIGGGGGGPFSYDCPTGYALTQVQGGNDGTGPGHQSWCQSNVTIFHKYACKNVTDGTVTSLTAKYGDSGQCPAAQAFDFGCPTGRYAYGITVYDATTYVGFTLGLNCR